MPARRGASGREWGQPDRIAEDTQRNASIAPPADARKLPPLGQCISCGQHIRVTVASTCGTCQAWRRWFSAHRLASQALREVR